MMKIRKLSIIIFIILCQQDLAYAGIHEIFTRPCDWAIPSGDRTIKETWNGKSKHHRKNELCPPWNRDHGRAGCLLGKPYPKPFEKYEEICAEATNNYKAEIKLRHQKCFALGWCYTDTVVLRHGQCSGFTGLYQLERVCARLAKAVMPKCKGVQGQDKPCSKNGHKADHGYTNNKHLNHEGATKTDKKFKLADGTTLIVALPKICAYNDPYLVDKNWNPDSYDDILYRQPLHKGQTAKDLDPSDRQGYINLLLLLGTNSKDLVLNKIVDKCYGCVEIPIGPMPPPFCDTLKYKITPSLERICESKPDGSRVKSSYMKHQGCVKPNSNIINNYIQNSFRITYNILLPICKDPNADPSDKCVHMIHPLSPTQQVARNHMIMKCSNSGASNCVNTTQAEASAGRGFRLVYGISYDGGKTAERSEYFYDDIRSCSTGDAICQKIWGVNAGQFQDVSLKFPKEEASGGNSSPLTDNTNMGNDNIEYTIFRKGDNEHSTDRIYAKLSSGSTIGDVPRAKPPKLKLSNSSNSTHLKPELRLTYEQNKVSTSTYLSVKTYKDIDMKSTNAVVNLAGNKFEAFVTDENYQTMPFPKGPRVPASAHDPSISIYGNYYNDVLVSEIEDARTKPENKDFYYLNGLEYLGSFYRMGGKHLCIPSSNLTQCSEDQTQCVVAVKELKADGTNPISLKLQDRIFPHPNAGAVLSDQLFYSKTNKNIPSNIHKMIKDGVASIRTKTPIEKGLCVAIPPASCAAVTEAPAGNDPTLGDIHWSVAEVGKNSIGTCDNGYTAQGTLKRKCAIKFNTKLENEFKTLLVELVPALQNAKCIKNTP